MEFTVSLGDVLGILSVLVTAGVFFVRYERRLSTVEAKVEPMWNRMFNPGTRAGKVQADGT